MMNNRLNKFLFSVPSVVRFLTLLTFVCVLNADDRPNILWLTSEDNNVTYVGCYGNEMAVTPNIDKLATEGFRYTHCYSNGAVCSASRTSWITGMNAVSMGGHNHRGRIEGSKDLVYYPSVLQKAGYFTGNFKKQDYNIIDTRIKKIWDSSKTPNWKTLKDNQPFFQVINDGASHESKAMGTDHIHDESKVKIPPYHPDVPVVRANYAHYYDAVTRMDANLGNVLKALENNGLSENTIVIYNSDHGGPLPRGKRYMYNSGTHCPLVIRIPEKYKSMWPNESVGTTVDRLVSFIDMPSTWISLAGGKIPKNYQGSVFLGENKTPEKKYHFSFRGRNDHRVENARSIRDKQFLYVRDFIPFVPRGQYLDYQWKIPLQRAWEEEYKAGRTNDVTGRFFKVKSKEELYDVSRDPYCINDLAQNPEYEDVLKNLSQQLTDQQVKLKDAGLIPETELLRRVKQNNTTPYDLIQKKELYDVQAYMSAAGIALEQDVGYRDELVQMTEHADSGVRYWGVTGLFMIRDQLDGINAQFEKLLKDDSHNVRAMAAWALIDVSQSKLPYDCMRDLIQSNSYAMLEIINIVDWMAELGKPLVPEFSKVKFKDKQFSIFYKYMMNGMAPLKVKKKK